MHAPRRLIRVLAAALCLSACRTPDAASGGNAGPAPAPTQQSPIRLTLVGTNDLHGWVSAQKNSFPGAGEVGEGGLATFAGYLANIREDNPGGVLLLDAGDLFQGTLASNLTEGEVVIEAYNRLGYTASAIGNHEFDYGPVGPVSVAAQPGVDPFGALKQRLKQAKFPLLAVNIYDAKTGDRPAWLGNDGTLLVDVKGVKVGIFGLVTPSTPFTTNPVNVSSLRFGSLAPEAISAAKRLREHGAQVVIAIAHAGGRCASIEDPHNTSSCDGQNGEIFEMLDQIPEHTVDAVIAGHTHAQIGQFVHGTPVIETPGQGRYFGMIQLYVDPKNKHVIEDKTEIKAMNPVCELVEEKTGQCDPKRIKDVKDAKFVPAMFLGKPVVKDPDVEKAIEPALARVEADQRRKLGIKVPETLNRNYDEESPLGDVLSDALREMEGADVAMLNPGGLRADIPAGDMTYGAIYEVLPFDNTVAILTVTGDELKRLISAAYGGKKGVFQISGVHVELSRCMGQGRLKTVTFADGRAIQPEKKYKVAVPDFLARGGDGLGPVVASLPPERVDLGMTRERNFRDSMVAYWQKRLKTLTPPKPGRISYADDGASCAGVKQTAR